MRNFDFLKDNTDFADLYSLCNDAEICQQSDPEKTALRSRQCLEYLVKVIYLLKGLTIADRASLFQLVDEEEFKSFINDDKLMMALHYIRKAGNNAAHTGRVSANEAFFCVLNLHTFVGAVLIKLEVVQNIPPFDKSLLPAKQEIRIIPTVEAEPAGVLISKFKGKISKEDTLNATNPNYFTEAETRKFYIDQLLREAGWEVLERENCALAAKAGIEIEVKGMPNTQGIGFVDYVLYGRNGIPLAVIEAKKTSVSPTKGKHQATLYADCIEKQYGIRPVIYYTNGYETYVVDGLGYPPRNLFGFHTIEELELFIRRKGRNDITDITVKEEITNRAYQKQAITAVCEHLNSKHRKALLVMATGTGKTRVSISLVDVLLRNNWVKNILFLADRTALVKQAHKNFIKLLPTVPCCVLSDSAGQRDMNARIMFSTYQTMINYIDSDSKDFSIGRFDLIIVDEAHRSIFGKYAAIFDYFDSFLVGLTATPRSEVEKSTYQIFDLEQGEPNFSYELDEAVADKYLVPYKGIVRHSEFMQRGIKYNNLSDEEKKQLEKIWEYEAAQNALDDKGNGRDIGQNEIFTYIFNEDTIDKVLQDLMQNGLKVQSEERIGKSIIFAYNHQHAELITKRFYKLYPQYGPDFCVLIDNQVKYAHDLIEQFEVRDKEPQIAVSVDMLDTGIDVPDVLNLVFFKAVKSKIKFMQMIGRGTRLSDDIFGYGGHKEEFYIFDYCENFAYFGQNPQGVEANPLPSLTEKIFNIKADLLFALQSPEYQNDAFAKGLYEELKITLVDQIASLNMLRIDVRKQLKFVDKFKCVNTWEYITLLDVLDLKNQISPLLTPTAEDVNTKRFDLIILNIELALLSPEVKPGKFIQKVITIAHALQEKASIPKVMAKMELIKEVQTEHFWDNRTLTSLERIRKELRDLMMLLEGESKQTFVVDIEDSIIIEEESTGLYVPKNYKQKIFEYITSHKESPAIRKIVNLEQLDRNDILALENILWKELGSKEDYDRYAQNIFGGGNVAVFIRSLIGVDRKVAVEKFSEFLSGNQLNSQQQEYLKTIINYVCENGDITPKVIIEEPPFDNFDWVNVFGANAIGIRKYVEKIHEIVVA